MDRQYFRIFLLVSYMTSLWTIGADGAALNDYILDYQPMEFDHIELREQHVRVKRDANPVLHWSFSAYDRSFNLTLKPAQSVFAPGHFVSNEKGKPINVDTSHIYDGYLIDNPSSSAHVAIMSDSVTGFIHIPGDTTYHIEPARKHNLNSNARSIIYPENKMNMDPYRHLRSQSCGNKELFEKLENMSRPLPETYSRQKRNAYSDSWTNSYNKYSKKANAYDDETLSRKKRAALVQGKRTCSMFLRADKLLFDHIKSQLTNSTGMTATEKAREEILSMFSFHISAITKIYETTNFVRKDDPSVSFTGIRFQLQRTEIIEDCTKVDPGYCTNNLDVSNFLDLTSKYLTGELDNYCLVTTFTYRDFVGGTLGLAWVGTPSSGGAGVCGKYAWISDGNGNRYKRSLNTGIVTLVNFSKDVPSKVSQLTLAHEVGHNFGAKHDPSSPANECAPFGTNLNDASKGNYIMFPSAAQGNLDHNDEFSACSRDYIAKVLETVGSVRSDCFMEDGAAFCGNKIVEDGEECDCGFGDTCDNSDSCCVSSNKATSDDKTACTRKKDTQCSPSEGRCCKSDCKIVTDTSMECQEATDCRKASNCDGVNANCTAPDHEKNYETFCDSYSNTCEDGECSASVCKNIGWTECMAEGVDSQMCFVSCRKTDGDPCVSSADATALEDVANAEFKTLLEKIQLEQNITSDSLSIAKPPGSNCDNFLGYCDILNKCSKYDAEGPFKQLTDLIFDPMNLQKVVDWITDHWWAVLLMCVGFVIFMGVFVWLFSYNTPNKDPKKTAAQKRRAAQTRPQQTRPQQTRPQQAQPNKRSGAYSVDVPMQERRGKGQPQGQVNQGYQHSGYPQQQKGQHFDRISGPRRY